VKGSEFVGQIDSMVRISKRFIPWRDYEKIKEDLFIIGKDEDKIMALYREHSEGLSLPRSYAVQRFGLGRLRDKMSYGSPITGKFLWSLDEKKRSQLRITGEIMDYVRPGVGAIAQAPCGFGKTVMAIFCLLEWAVTTVVFVHTEFLAEQWEETLIEATDLTFKDIGRVQRDRCEFRGKKVVIAITPSVSKAVAGDRKGGDYPKAFYTHFGCAIFDETHRYGAEKWSQIIGAFPAAYRLGVSATPERKDGMTPVINHHIGPIASTTLSYQNAPTIFSLPYQAAMPYKSICLWSGGRPSSRVSLAKIQTRLAKDERRNHILSEILDACIDSGRKTIVFSDRLEQLRTLKRLLAHRGQGDSEVGFYIGGMKQAQRIESSRKQLILSTYALGAEGLDIPALDTVVLATPRANVEQSIGRILREYDNKMAPWVIDMADRIASTGLPTILSNKRELFYESKGWKIRRIMTAELLEAISG